MDRSNEHGFPQPSRAGSLRETLVCELETNMKKF